MISKHIELHAQDSGRKLQTGAVQLAQRYLLAMTLSMVLFFGVVNVAAEVLVNAI